jgi:flagellar biosynthetic protein FlhB
VSQSGAGEKTEKASAKKKRDARKKGEVHKSQDAISALSMVVMFATIYAMWSTAFSTFQTFLSQNLSDSYIVTQSNTISNQSVHDVFSNIFSQALSMLLPIFAVAMLVGVIGNVIQTGPMFVPNRIMPKFSKINPINGFKRLFSVTSLVELFKSICKVTILGVLVYQTIFAQISNYPAMMTEKVDDAFNTVMTSCLMLGIKMGGAFLIFALLDMFYQWWKFEKDLRMTKQEVKEEHKQLEGDPQIKAKIRQKQRAMSARRMMEQLQSANVVVTNPTHFAVALRYDEKADKAPVIVAKGQDYLAQKIKEKAREFDITIVENKPVARALYAACEIGDQIPAQMYQAIADILVYVYRLKNKGKGV